MNLPTHYCVLILAAMEEEERALLLELLGIAFEEKSLSHRLSLSIKIFVIGTRTLLVARSGMGTVNAALLVALAAEQFPLDAIFLLGVGGALTSTLNIGDLVVSSHVLQHDYFSSLEFGMPRMAPGALILNEADALGHSALITADPDLVRWASETQVPGKKVVIGTVLSGSEFVGTTERKRAIAALHENAVLVDMEAAGVAQVASQMRLPFAVVKTVADRLSPDGSIESDFSACLAGAAANAAMVVRRILAG